MLREEFLCKTYKRRGAAAKGLHTSSEHRYQIVNCGSQLRPFFLLAEGYSMSEMLDNILKKVSHRPQLFIFGG